MTLKNVTFAFGLVLGVAAAVSCWVASNAIGGAPYNVYALRGLTIGLASSGIMLTYIAWSSLKTDRNVAIVQLMLSITTTLIGLGFSTQMNAPTSWFAGFEMAVCAILYLANATGIIGPSITGKHAVYA